jgi:hypothetical protein
MTGRTLIFVVALSLVFVVVLSLAAPRPAAADDDWPAILAGLAVGYLVYDALDNNDRNRCGSGYGYNYGGGHGYGYGYSYGYGYNYCPPPPPIYEPYYRPPKPHYDNGWHGGSWNSWNSWGGHHGEPNCRGGGW